MKTNTMPSAMAFYHEDGLVPAWKQAKRFAGNGGRIATMLDVVDLRIAGHLESPAWNQYYTTSSAEYFGRSKSGRWVIIVAHGVGPMATLEGACKAYSYQYDDKSGARRGGRITQREFWNLEDGNYGDVHIVDWEWVVRKYKYPFLETLTEHQALCEPLLEARFGPRWHAYIKCHAEISRNWLKQEGHGNIADPFIVDMNAANNCSYGDLKYLPRVEEGMAYAHLLSTGGLRNIILSGHQQQSLTIDVGGHGWHDGTRFVAIRAGSPLNIVHPGIGNIQTLIRDHWRELLKPVASPQPVGFRLLTKLGEEWFTTVLKKGARMDNYSPEFHVTSIKLIGEPREFTTTVGGYHGFFKYGINEVEAIRPQGANGYTIVGEIEIVWNDGNPTHHKTKVQFYQVEVDVTLRLLQEKAILEDHELLMSLLFKKEVPSTVSVQPLVGV